jgi:membrane-anchored protein YejM (alkaline phosphatase superfamily)
MLLILAAISTASMLYLIFYLFSLFFKFNAKFRVYLLAIIFTLTNIALVVDFFIYKIFNFHINAMVLNILTSPDAFDSIQIGVMPIVVFVLIVIALIVVEIFIIKYSIKSSSNIKIKYLVLAILLLSIIEKISFGFATAYARGDIISAFRVIPLYQPLTFNKFANKYLNIKAKDQAKYAIKTDAVLKYPLKDMIIDKTKDKFNIFIIAFDAARYDFINKTITPNIVSFSKDAISLPNHHSGGNSTRFGIFSFIYGLNSTYWFSFLHAYQKPILFDVLKELDYDISIFSSTNTNWPEFRKTCYIDIQDKIYDNFKGSPWQKDTANIDSFIKYIKQVDRSKPIFSFIFLDAPHGYSFPKSVNIFGAKKNLNYLAVKPKSKELNNTIAMYKNAMHYDDSLFAKFITTLKEKNLYDNSLIIFTSDHGQEFYEYGYFGHNTAFSPAQTHVPMLIKLPKGMKKVSILKLTSHQDIIPSILKRLGVTNSLNDFSNAIDIFSSNKKRDYIFCANWNNSAIITKDKISVFSNKPNRLFSNELRDSKSYKKIDGSIPTKYILDAINQNKKFLK